MTSAVCLAIALLAGPGNAPPDATPWTISSVGQAAPQDEQEFVRKTWQKHGALSDPGYFFAGLLARETLLWGDWYDGNLDKDDYGDLFKPGTGLVGEIGGMIVYREDWRVGLYLSVGWDTYKGDSIEDPLGNALKPDDMTIFTGLLGFRGMLHFAEIFYVEAHVAGGAAYYQAVDATYLGADFELFTSSAGPAGEVGARFGIELVYLQLEIGIGYRVQGGPARGKDAGTAVDPEMMNCFLIELGGAIRF